jgi:hypothetical protein
MTKQNRSPIIAQLLGNDAASALGVTVRSGSPIIALCRKLLAAGHAAAIPLEVYRGKTLALTVRSIGEAARLRATASGFLIDPEWAAR